MHINQALCHWLTSLVHSRKLVSRQTRTVHTVRGREHIIHKRVQLFFGGHSWVGTPGGVSAFPPGWAELPWEKKYFLLRSPPLHPSMNQPPLPSSRVLGVASLVWSAFKCCQWLDGFQLPGEPSWGTMSTALCSANKTCLTQIFKYRCFVWVLSTDESAQLPIQDESE